MTELVKLANIALRRQRLGYGAAAVVVVVGAALSNTERALFDDFRVPGAFAAVAGERGPGPFNPDAACYYTLFGPDGEVRARPGARVRGVREAALPAAAVGPLAAVPEVGGSRDGEVDGFVPAALAALNGIGPGLGNAVPGLAGLMPGGGGGGGGDAATAPGTETGTAPSETPTPTPTPTASPTAEPSATPSPSATPTGTPTATPTPTPTATATTPAATATTAPEPSPTPAGTATPAARETVAAKPDPAPAADPTASPAAEPSTAPAPDPDPTAQPAPIPTPTSVLPPIDPTPAQPVVTAAEPSMSTAVPEPGTWAMLILGFGLIGRALRRRRRANPAEV